MNIVKAALTLRLGSMLLNFLNPSSWSPRVHKHGDEGLRSLFSISGVSHCHPAETMSASLLPAGVLGQRAGEPVLRRLSAYLLMTL